MTLAVANGTRAATRERRRSGSRGRWWKEGRICARRTTVEDIGRRRACRSWSTPPRATSVSAASCVRPAPPN